MFQCSNFTFGSDEFSVEVDDQGRVTFYVEGGERVPLFRVGAESLLNVAAEAILYVGIGMDILTMTLKQSDVLREPPKLVM